MTYESWQLGTIEGTMGDSGDDADMLGLSREQAKPFHNRCTSVVVSTQSWFLFPKCCLCFLIPINVH